MKALPWFRMYTDFLDDPKMIGLAFEDQRHFIAVLALKSSGVLETDCDPKLLNRIVAQRLWVDQSAIIEVKNRLKNAGLIFDNWQPVAWDKRQMHSDHDDSGAERQRKFRENRRNALRNGQVTDTVTAGNADVTPPEEIRGDKKKPPQPPDGGGDDFLKPEKPHTPAELPPGFAEFWKTWPTNDRKQARGKCLESWKKANAERDAALVLAHVAQLKTCEMWTKQNGQFVPAPLVYLNKRAWDGADISAQQNNGIGVFL